MSRQDLECLFDRIRWLHAHDRQHSPRWILTMRELAHRDTQAWVAHYCKHVHFGVR